MPSLHVLEFIRGFGGSWNLPESEVDRLRRDFPSVDISSPRDLAEAEQLLPDADVVLGWAVRRSNFASANRLKWIQVTAAGVTPLMFPELIASDVIVTNGRGLYAVAMAEHTLGVMLAFARKLHLARDAQRERRWVQEALEPTFGCLAGSTLGLIGFGSIGQALAERSRALGQRVIAVRRHPAPDPAPAHEQWGPEALPRLLAESDWIVLAAPLTPQSRGMIGAAEIERMKPSAVLINLGRGALIDEAALIQALGARRIAGAGLDVFEKEPLPEDSPLWEMPHVIVTPHVSGFAPDLWVRAMELFRENLRRFVEGAPLLNVVDKRAGY